MFGSIRQEEASIRRENEELRRDKQRLERECEALREESRLRLEREDRAHRLDDMERRDRQQRSLRIAETWEESFSKQTTLLEVELRDGVATEHAEFFRELTRVNDRARAIWTKQRERLAEAERGLQEMTQRLLKETAADLEAEMGFTPVVQLLTDCLRDDEPTRYLNW